MRVNRRSYPTAHHNGITVVRIAHLKPLQKNLLPGNDASGSNVQNVLNVPQASRPWLFTTAAHGGLHPALVSRVQGAYAHLLHCLSTRTICILYPMPDFIGAFTTSPSFTPTRDLLSFTQPSIPDGFCDVVQSWHQCRMIDSLSI